MCIRDRLWGSHVDYLEKKKKSKIREYYFRNKINGWHTHTEKAVFHNNLVDTKSFSSQLNKKLYHTKVFFRPVCYECPYADLSLIHIYIGYYHFAHSYVRGNWRREEDSAPMILAKACHDLDIIQWLVGEKCEALSSFGNLFYFKKENAPEGLSLIHI